MILYIEGVDGSGKSTLANRITTSTQIQSLFTTIVPDAEQKISTNPRSAVRVDYKTLTETLLEWGNDPDTLYIMDRGPLSDIIYRVFDDLTPVMSLIEFMKLYAKIPYGMHIVYCYNKGAYDSMIERGDDNPVALNRHKELTKLYTMIMPLFPIFTYNYVLKDRQPHLILSLHEALSLKQKHIRGGKQ